MHGVRGGTGPCGECLNIGIVDTDFGLYCTGAAPEESRRWREAARAKAWIYGGGCQRIGVGPHLVGRPDRLGHLTEDACKIVDGNMILLAREEQE